MVSSSGCATTTRMSALKRSSGFGAGGAVGIADHAMREDTSRAGKILRIYIPRKLQIRRLLARRAVSPPQAEGPPPVQKVNGARSRPAACVGTVLMSDPPDQARMTPQTGGGQARAACSARTASIRAAISGGYGAVRRARMSAYELTHSKIEARVPRVSFTRNIR